jgi:hypothetical protein
MTRATEVLEYRKARLLIPFACSCVIQAVVTAYGLLGGSMIQKLGIVCMFGLVLVSGVNSASALGPIQSSPSIQGDVVAASFFGRPYPYGYTGWGPCVRYVEVQTRWGLRLRRVRACR